jgi:hypothetical protein
LAFISGICNNLNFNAEMKWTLTNILPKLTSNRFALLIILFSTCFLVPLSPMAQEKSFKQDDVFALFMKASKRAARDSAAAKPVILRKPYFSTTPYVGYNPAYGMLIGVGSTIGMYLGEPPATPISTAVVSVNLTTKSQILFNLRTNIYTRDARFVLRGDWRFLIFSQSTYGLGTGVKHQRSGGIILNDGGQTNPIMPDEEPIKYNYIRLYESVYFRATDWLYAGLGYNLDHFSGITDEKLSLGPDSVNITHHYRYSDEHGFDSSKYVMSGLSVELLMDSRDNAIRPTRGLFANISFRPNFSFLGSSQNSLMLNTEFRGYKKLSQKRPDHLLGFWFIGQFTQDGKVPYLGLPAIAWDMYNRTGRGYIQGSIRGTDFIYGEVEYRYPISRYTGILSGVVFFNVTTASSDDGTRDLFQYLDPAAGVGLRIMFNRRTLSNLAVDFGMGADRKLGVYFNLNETF